MNDGLHSSFRYLKTLPYFRPRHAICEKSPNGYYFGFGELRASAIFALVHPLPTLVDHIMYVFQVSASPEVKGIYAKRMIAGMTHFSPLRNFPIVKFVGKTVRFEAFAPPCQFAVSMTSFCALPRPTLERGTLGDMRRKSILQGFMCRLLDTMTIAVTARLTFYMSFCFVIALSRFV